MQPHAKCVGCDTDHCSSLCGLEAQQIDQNECFTRGGWHRQERFLNAESPIVVNTDCDIRVGVIEGEYRSLLGAEQRLDINAFAHKTVAGPLRPRSTAHCHSSTLHGWPRSAASRRIDAAPLPRITANQRISSRVQSRPVLMTVLRGVPRRASDSTSPGSCHVGWPCTGYGSHGVSPPDASQRPFVLTLAAAYTQHPVESSISTRVSLSAMKTTERT